ncbi:hypothetical protein BDR04DRAFT_1092828 [Suillus decipiens]|nr:hypothetical protein BDR04DRAFT_1092828 [Suillus decipiens]
MAEARPTSARRISVWLALEPRSSASPPRALLLGFFGYFLLLSLCFVGFQQRVQSVMKIEDL